MNCNTSKPVLGDDDVEGDPEELVLQRQDLHKRLDLNSNTCKSVLGDDDVEGDPEELVLQRQDLHRRLETTEAELVKSKFKLARSNHFSFLTTVVYCEERM